MPTTYPRFHTTRTPRVEHILQAARERGLTGPPGEVLVTLAEQAIATPPRSASLPTFHASRRLTSEMVADLLDDD